MWLFFDNCSLSQRFKAFTLAEILIALAILGVIATFTIPKILTANQNNQWNAATKEAVSTICAAHQMLVANNQLSTSSSINDLLQYINYVSVDANHTIDNQYNAGTASLTCNGGNGGICIKLHSGAYIYYWSQDTFGGTSATNGIAFYVDPDGILTDPSSTSGPDKSVQFFIYYNGNVKSYNNVNYTTYYNNGGPLAWGPCTGNCNPPWFHWN